MPYRECRVLYIYIGKVRLISPCLLELFSCKDHNDDVKKLKI